ncbi:MAG: hypothetical protein M5U16_10695 [Hyphomicrobium sp.]|nr:hypothetical protein [Hyphomicrobium sp.]
MERIGELSRSKLQLGILKIQLAMSTVARPASSTKYGANPALRTAI